MTNSKTYTLFQRLCSDSNIGLNFDYMGKAEYEFGTAHAALDAMVNDLGTPKETVETQIHLKPSDFFGYEQLLKGPRARQTKAEHARELKDRGHIRDLLDGQPLRLRHLPALADENEVDNVMSATTMDAFQNAGGMIRNDTRAWLCISPVVGILYHPSQEKTVNTFLAAITKLREDKEPDAVKRGQDTLRKLQTNGIGDCRTLRILISNLESDGPGL